MKTQRAQRLSPRSLRLHSASSAVKLLDGRVFSGSSEFAKNRLRNISYSFTSAQEIGFFEAPGEFNDFLSAVADFNGDGYDDLLLIESKRSARKASHSVIGSAVDVNDPSKGFKFGPVHIRPDGIIYWRVAPADLDGDGQPEIVAIYSDLDRPASLRLSNRRVDPKTLEIIDIGRLELDTLMYDPIQAKYDPLQTPYAMQIAAGRFTAEPRQQAVVAISRGQYEGVILRVIDFEPKSLTPVLKTIWDSGQVPTFLAMKTGRLDWSYPYDRLVLMTGRLTPYKSYGDWARAESHLDVLTVDPATLAIARSKAGFSGGGNVYEGNPVLMDIAIGNFDNMKPKESNRNERERDPNLQIAAIYGYYSADLSNTFALQPTIYNVAYSIPNVPTEPSGLQQTSYQYLDHNSFVVLLPRWPFWLRWRLVRAAARLWIGLPKA